MTQYKVITPYRSTFLDYVFLLDTKHFKALQKRFNKNPLGLKITANPENEIQLHDSSNNKLDLMLDHNIFLLVFVLLSANNNHYVVHEVHPVKKEDEFEGTIWEYHYQYCQKLNNRFIGTLESGLAQKEADRLNKDNNTSSYTPVRVALIWLNEAFDEQLKELKTFFK